jgi:Flp pilus assembly pilin Flp
MLAMFKTFLRNEPGVTAVERYALAEIVGRLMLAAGSAANIGYAIYTMLP